MDLKANAAAVALLRRGAWFGSLPPDLQATILQRGVVRPYRRGQVIIQEGEPAKGLFAVLEGVVRGVCQVGDAEEVLIHVGDAGLWFGVYGLLSGALSIGSVIADAASRVLMLPIAEFGRIVEEEPRYYRHFAALPLWRSSTMRCCTGMLPRGTAWHARICSAGDWRTWRSFGDATTRLRGPSA